MSGINILIYLFWKCWRDYIGTEENFTAQYFNIDFQLSVIYPWTETYLYWSAGLYLFGPHSSCSHKHGSIHCHEEALFSLHWWCFYNLSRIIYGLSPHENEKQVQYQSEYFDLFFQFYCYFSVLPVCSYS